MENCRFSRRLRLDWGNTTQAATAGLGSEGLISHSDSILIVLPNGIQIV